MVKALVVVMEMGPGRATAKVMDMGMDLDMVND